ncbi:beta-ketoacyl synthase chain length factor [Vibrio mangrovi]|uniref:Beta-ketoacyl synthase chain length factor n=1 Tax=Vibrio mangrovi TaxID=474394 RepID=A0A1Y6IR35_9VIBR|nr:beta-ketoacyl synthase chain length factor [Vibrio mangrovi]MDW6001844.1 beta-ketoacyl synthase chain length factor [Vibrio mangrovi]SMS00129.1 hypothetical protein VIM7927_01370 [Vibrio mangrovi]
MSKYSPLLSFNINSWAANSEGFSQLQDWYTWSQSLQWPESTPLQTHLIPPMMRRRMSHLSKLAVQTALHFMQNHSIHYLVFSSRHGELTRSAKIIEDILRGEDASPMAFSQSVHNSAAGLSTIACQQPIPLTSISAMDNTFHSAIQEAWIYLQQEPEHQVLVVDFDEPLPEPYHIYEEDEYRGYALGLLLSSGKDWELTSQKQSSSPGKPLHLPQGLTFLCHYLNNESSWCINGSNQQWRWQRCGS